MAAHRTGRVALTVVVTAIAATSFFTVGAVEAAPDPGVTAIDCATPSSVFDTGATRRLDAAVADGDADLRWEVSQRYDPPKSPATPVDRADLPRDLDWRAATVGKVAAEWGDSPYFLAPGQWVSREGPDSAPVESGDGYYRYRFDLAADVDPGRLSLGLDLLADSSVAQVWVNGAPQSDHLAPVPQFERTPYAAPGYAVENRAMVTLDRGFRRGRNDIVVRVNSSAPAAGLRVVARPGPICTPPADAPALAASPLPGLIVVSGGEQVWTADTTPTITGHTTHVTPGSAVAVTVHRDPVTVVWRGTTTTRADGSWSLQVPDGAALAEHGAYTVEAQVDDADGARLRDTQTLTVGSSADRAGNGARARQALAIDLQAPVIDIAPLGATGNHSPTIRGTSNALPGSPVRVTVAGQTLVTTVAVDGTWDATPMRLPDGAHEVRATVTDVAGNTGEARQQVRIVSPEVTILDGKYLSAETGAVVIYGAASAVPGSRVVVSLNGEEYGAIVGADHRWSVGASRLSPGRYDVYATLSDSFGNVARDHRALRLSLRRVTPGGTSLAPGIPGAGAGRTSYNPYSPYDYANPGSAGGTLLPATGYDGPSPAWGLTLLVAGLVTLGWSLRSRAGRWEPRHAR